MPARWKVLVADDEPAARRGVKQLLDAFPEFSIVGECRDGRELLACLDRLAPDVLFLDVQMPEIDGFEVIRRRTPERMPWIVFLTAFDQFAVQAFDAEALDYLVKPVTEARFGETMRRLMRRLQNNGASVEPTIIIATGRGTIVIRLGEIDWIESADDYARVWVGARSYLLRQSLDKLEQRVGAHGFVRVHRCALVRLASVRAVERQRGGATMALLANGTKVSVSRRRRAEFAAALKIRP